YWHLHPNGDDIAVFSIDLHGKDADFFSISTDHFITPEIMKDFDIGPGDDVFLVGRLVTLAGRQKNSPVARFGNISMMPDQEEPVLREDGTEQVGFLIDSKSLSGFSGSPVFVIAPRACFYPDPIPKGLSLNRLAQGETPHTGLKAESIGISGTFGPWLLG